MILINNTHHDYGIQFQLKHTLEHNMMEDTVTPQHNKSNIFEDKKNLVRICLSNNLIIVNVRDLPV